MILRGKNIRIGSWALPYIEELLAGEHVHNPCWYLEGKAGMISEFDPEQKVYTRHGWRRSYMRSWANALTKVCATGIEIVGIPNAFNSDPIYILKKYLPRLLTKNRLIDEHGERRLYRLENRVLYFKTSSNAETFQILPAKCRKIQDIMVAEVVEKLDEVTDDNPVRIIAPHSTIVYKERAVYPFIMDPKDNLRLIPSRKHAESLQRHKRSNKRSNTVV